MIADYDPARAEKAAATDERFVARADRRLRRRRRWRRSCREHRITHVMNAVDPIFNMPIFDGAFAAGADYLDMAMSLSKPHPDAPYEQTGVKLGDEQFAEAGEWEEAGRLALVGIGVEPGLSDVFARYAADHLFSEIDEVGMRDGANLVVTDEWQRDLRAVVLDVDDDRGVPQPSGDLARRTEVGSRPSRSASRRSSTSPRASAPSSASTWSTKRCS